MGHWKDTNPRERYHLRTEGNNPKPTHIHRWKLHSSPGLLQEPRVLRSSSDSYANGAISAAIAPNAWLSTSNISAVISLCQIRIEPTVRQALLSDSYQVEDAFIVH